MKWAHALPGLCCTNNEELEAYDPQRLGERGYAAAVRQVPSPTYRRQETHRTSY